MSFLIGYSHGWGQCCQGFASEAYTCSTCSLLVICLQVHNCDCYLLIVIRLLIAVKGRTLNFAKVFCKRGCNLILQMFYACTGVWRRWVYQGVIDDPYGEFLVDENKSLQKVIVKLTLYWESFTSLVWSLALTFADLSTYLVNLTS